MWTQKMGLGDIMGQLKLACGHQPSGQNGLERKVKAKLLCLLISLNQDIPLL